MIEHNNAVDKQTHTHARRRRVVIARAPRKTVTIKTNYCRGRFGSIEECRGGAQICAGDARGARHSRRVSVDVKTTAGTRVPERAGHVQNAREATRIALRHTYAAVECSSVYYNAYYCVYVICIKYISIIKLLL